MCNFVDIMFSSFSLDWRRGIAIYLSIVRRFDGSCTFYNPSLLGVVWRGDRFPSIQGQREREKSERERGVGGMGDYRGLNVRRDRGGCCPPMDLMRSEAMQLVRIIVPVESAHLTLSYLGDLGLFQFKDVCRIFNAFPGSIPGCSLVPVCSLPNNE